MGMFMENSELFSLIERLPEIAKHQVQHLVIHLVNKERNSGSADFNDVGFLIADDFNTPMKEFHDYMYNIDIEFIEKIEQLPFVKQNELETLVDSMLLDVKDK